MPTLHIKLGLMNSFVKELGRALSMGLHFFATGFPESMERKYKKASLLANKFGKV